MKLITDYCFLDLHAQIADFHMSYYDWEDYRIVLDPMLNEFWAQGDLETRMGRSIKIDPIFDRGEIQHVPKFQVRLNS